MNRIGMGIVVVGSLLSGQPPGELRIFSDVRLVVVDVSVRNHEGHPVQGIKRDAFRVFDNGVPRPVTAFADEDAPVTAGLVADCSGSMQRKRGELLMAAEALVAESNPADEMFLITFNDSVRPGPVGGAAVIRAALDATPVQGRTALFDGIKAGLERLAKGTKERKCLVVISDGADNASVTSRREILREAELAHATIYTIGILDEGAKDRNPGFLREIAGLTGGSAHVDIPAAELTATCRRIAKDIRSRYMIGFGAAQTERTETRRIRIDVATNEKVRVVARRTYVSR